MRYSIRLSRRFTSYVAVQTLELLPLVSIARAWKSKLLSYHKGNPMKVLSLVLSVSFLAGLALAQGAPGVAVVSGVAPQPAPEVIAGPGIPPGVRSETISADSTDARAVRVILDANGLTKVTVADVAVVEGGRIVGLYLQERGVEEIPDYPSTLSYLDQLKTLHLYGNRKLQLPLLKRVPVKISDCARLEELLLQHNDLGTLPATIAQVPHLKTLSLADNHLHNLPPAVAEFAKRLDPQGLTRQNGPAAPTAPSKPRFAITERDWPAQYGAASVCLWKDDAFAAFSITIDDNCAPDHEWWLEMGRKYGIRATWFVITGMVSDGTDPRGSYWGSWAAFRKLFAAGHDVQSHTVCHGNLKSPKWTGIEGEYSESKKEIEKNIPGDRCLTLAYPDGAATEGMKRLAAKYFIGARGGSGSLNSVNRVDYLLTASLGGHLNLVPCDQPGMTMATMFEKGRYDYANFYRGWYCNHEHNVNVEYKGTRPREEREKQFAVIQEKVAAGQLWMGLFREVCQYGQERDTAHLETTEATKGRVVLKLTDGLMDDPRFDFPLTVKVRLDPHWKTVVATQAAKPVEAKLIEHAGDTYALVQVVPGRGEVTLTDGSK